MTDISDVRRYIRANGDLYVERLKDWVSIPSVSSNPALRSEVVRMVHAAKSEWDKLGAETVLKDIGFQQTSDGVQIPLPPVLMGKIGNDPKKKTVCLYGHVDVQPALVSDGWKTYPFTLTVDKEGRMFGRGASDDKGPALAWLNVIEAFQKCNVQIPVNVKFIFEGMEECGSAGLEKLIHDEKDKFLKDIDYVCISDNEWLGTEKPCLAYGARGMAYFFVSIQCATKDLHSGVYGGAVSEAMIDLMTLMSKLVDSQGQILIPGVYDSVLPLTEDEEKLYINLDFDPDGFREDIGASKLIHDSKEKLAMNFWRYPSLSIHGIQGAFSDSGCKTVIPKKVTGKFSIRLVPNMELDKVEQLVKSYLENEFSKTESCNKLDVVLDHGVEAWLSDFNSPQYKAGRNAVKSVFGVEPDLIRDGGTVPVTLYFQEALGKSVIMIPMGVCDDATHSQNEKLDQFQYFKGMELFAEYINQLAIV